MSIVEAATPQPGGLQSDDPGSDPTISLVVAGLRARYPDTDPAIVQRCVEEAARRFEDARIRTFLPTLIERTAAEALRSDAQRAGA